METVACIQSFNDTIDTWIAGLRNYSLEMLCRKPAPGSWSLGQVYMHIVADTSYFVEQMKACLQNNGADSEKEMHPFARSLFINNGFPDERITGPATDDTVPQPRNREELLQGLLFIKEEANLLCHSFDFNASTGKTAHPGLLYFNASEWLRFAEIHMRHHFRQKKRIDAVLGIVQA